MSSNRESKDRSNFMCLKRIHHAMHLAEMAIKSEEESLLALALTHYKHAVEILDAECSAFKAIGFQDGNEENSNKMLETIHSHSRIYRSKIKVLEQMQFNYAAIHISTQNNNELSTAEFAQRKERSKSISELPFRIVKPRADSKVEPPPPDKVELIYWKMRLFSKLIREGGHLTPKIYIPEEVWTQNSAKVPGLFDKKSAFEEITKLIVRIENLGLPSSNKDIKPILDELMKVCEELPVIQNQLHLAFSFIPEKIIKKDQEKATSFSRFTAAISKTYTSVVKSVNESVQNRLSGSELKSYFDTISILFDHAQYLLKLQSVMYSLDTDDSKGIGSRKFNTASPKNALISPKNANLNAGDPKVKEKLFEIAHFLDSVVLLLVVKDVSSLLQRYIRKSRKSFLNPLITTEEKDR